MDFIQFSVVTTKLKLSITGREYPTGYFLNTYFIWSGGIKFEN